MARRSLTKEAQRVFEEGLEGKSLKELKTLYSSWRLQTRQRLKNLQSTDFTKKLPGWKTPEYRQLKDLGIGKKAPAAGSEEEAKQIRTLKEAIYEQSYFLRSGIDKKRWGQLSKDLTSKDWKIMNKLAPYGFIDPTILDQLYEVLDYVENVEKKETSPIPGKSKSAKPTTTIAEILGLNRATANLLDFESTTDPEAVRKMQLEVYDILEEYETKIFLEEQEEVAKAVEDAKSMSVDALEAIEDVF